MRCMFTNIQNLMPSLFLITLQISSYFSRIPSSLIKKDKFFPPFSKYFMYPIICGKKQLSRLKNKIKIKKQQQQQKPESIFKCWYYTIISLDVVDFFNDKVETLDM